MKTKLKTVKKKIIKEAQDLSLIRTCQPECASVLDTSLNMDY